MATYNYASGGFPTTPATNDTLIINGTSYLYNGSAWEVVGDSSYTSSATAPTSPANGDHWFDSTNGVLYVRVDANWVDVSTAGATSGGGGGGAMEFISTATVSSNVSSVDISVPSTYNAYMLKITDFTVTATAGLKAQFKAGGSVYSANEYGLYSLLLKTSAEQTHHRYEAWNAFYISNTNAYLTSTANQTMSAVFYIYPSSTNLSRMTWDMTFNPATSTHAQVTGAGTLQSVQSVDGISLTLNTGSISGGKFSLYGIKDS